MTPCAFARRALAATAVAALYFAGALHVERDLQSGSTWEKPNILYVVIDDFGWGDAAWHWESGETPAGVKMPRMTRLVKEQGLELDRHYAYQVCSPTRSAIQSGRNPLQVNALNLKGSFWNPSNNKSGFAGIPTDMTCMAEVLQSKGYITHMYGKWDAGFSSAKQLPQSRGYAHSLVYFTHGPNPWTFEGGSCATSTVDLWFHAGPAHNIYETLGPSGCSQESQKGCKFQDHVFSNHVITAIEQHEKNNNPFFIMWAPHLVHDPYAVPELWEQKWEREEHKEFRLYFAMIEYLDSEFARVIDAVKQNGFWSTTLVVVHSDNGGAVTEGHGGNNFPLRGGKATNWEGGIRTAGFVTGGVLPDSRRGQKETSLMTAWDWYHTFASLANVGNISDPVAKAAGLPDIDDSYNQWPIISGERKSGSARSTIFIGDASVSKAEDAWVGGIIDGSHKLLLGTMRFDFTTERGGASKEFRKKLAQDTGAYNKECGETPATGCLYDIFADPEESHNIASKEPEIFNELLHKIKNYGDIFNPDRGSDIDIACKTAKEHYNSFLGPHVDVKF